MKVFKLLLAFCFLFVLTTNVIAKSKDGVDMPDEITVEGKKLVLNGMGTRTATILMIPVAKVYVAGLYVEQKSGNPDEILAGGMKQLVLQMKRNVDKKDVLKAWTEGFKKNGEYDAMKSRIDILAGWMFDTKENDTMTFTFVPGADASKGKLNVSLAPTNAPDVKPENKRNATGGTIEGEDFTKAFFKIWLGQNPPNPKLKTGLLGAAE